MDHLLLHTLSCQNIILLFWWGELYAGLHLWPLANCICFHILNNEAHNCISCECTSQVHVLNGRDKECHLRYNDHVQCQKQQKKTVLCTLQLSGQSTGNFRHPIGLFVVILILCLGKMDWKVEWIKCHLTHIVFTAYLMIVVSLMHLCFILSSSCYFSTYASSHFSIV